MPKPKTVPRDQYDLVLARAERAERQADETLTNYHAVVKQLAAMKRKGYDVASDLHKPRMSKGHEKSDEEIVQDAQSALIRKKQQDEADFVERMTADLVRQGVGRDEARKEALRIRRETASTTVQP